MGEAYRTWIILLHQSTVCMRGATCFLIHQDVKAKASNLRRVWLKFSKKVCHRDGEVDVIIPEFVEEKEIVKRIQCLHCSDKFVKKISASD